MPFGCWYSGYQINQYADISKSQWWKGHQVLSFTLTECVPFAFDMWMILRFRAKPIQTKWVTYNSVKSFGLWPILKLKAWSKWNISPGKSLLGIFIKVTKCVCVCLDHKTDANEMDSGKKNELITFQCSLL